MRLIRPLVLSFCLLLPLVSHASISVNQPFESINGEVQFLEDPADRLTIDMVRTSGSDWSRQQEGKAFNQGYSDSAW